MLLYGGLAKHNLLFSSPLKLCELKKKKKMDAKIKTLGNFTAPALFTFGVAIPQETNPAIGAFEYLAP